MMTTTRNPAPRRRPDSLFFPFFEACPSCGGAVRGESIVDLSLFFCAGCESWWHVELGVVYRVTIPRDDAHP